MHKEGEVQEGVETTVYVVKYWASSGVFQATGIVQGGRLYLSDHGKGLDPKYWDYTRAGAVSKLAELIGGAVVKCKDKLDELRQLNPEALIDKGRPPVDTEVGQQHFTLMRG